MSVIVVSIPELERHLFQCQIIITNQQPILYLMIKINCLNYNFESMSELLIKGTFIQQVLKQTGIEFLL